MPGPLLVMQAITALKDVRKSYPQYDTMIVKTATVKQYAAKKTKMEDDICDEIVLLPIRRGITRLGAVVVMNDFFN